MLLRRGAHLLTASYDPVTRRLQVADGIHEGEFLLQMLAEEGALTGEEGHEAIDTGDGTVERWGQETLTAAEDLLRERITELEQLAVPLRCTLLGLHPHADGTLRTSKSTALVQEQITALLRPADLLRVPD